MRQRPQPSPRRGLIRAALVIICLAALLLAALLVVSSLTAPTVRAPVAPTLSPKSIPTATVNVVPIHPTVSPAPKPGATHQDVSALVQGDLRGEYPRRQSAGATRVPGILPVTARSAAAPLHGDALAYFAGHGDAYAASPLYLRPGTRHTAIRIGSGDALIRPAWSPDGREVMYVSVRQISSVPGARWTVMVYDSTHGGNRTLLALNALHVTPLGWILGHPAILVSTGTDSSVYAAKEGRPHLMGIVMPQPFTSAWLSPRGNYIAMGAPTNCSFCTLDVYNTRTTTLWVGPTGMPHENDIAWAPDERLVAALVQNRIVVSTPEGQAVGAYRAPRSLPRVWPHVMKLTLRSGTLTLTDTVTHASYSTAHAEPVAA
ncbi:MAG: hypothetical protein NVS4B2_23030 [Chloroflexota bacterium]